MYCLRRRRYFGWISTAPRWGGLVLFSLAILFVLSLRVAPVRGASMEPTLRDGEWLCYQSLPSAWLPIDRGDLVVFRSPFYPEQRYVKRVVGLPGDELRFERGELRVNGKPFELPASLPRSFTLSAKVPPDSFFALGDHAVVSYDSRRFGAVPKRLLVGRVLLSIDA